MDANSVNMIKDPGTLSQSSMLLSPSSINSVESVNRSLKSLQSGAPLAKVSGLTASARKNAKGMMMSGSVSNGIDRTTRSSTLLNAASARRRNSTGGMLEKKSDSRQKRVEEAPLAEKQTRITSSGQGNHSIGEKRRASLPSGRNKALILGSTSDPPKNSPVSLTTKVLESSPKYGNSKREPFRKAAAKASSSSISTLKRVPSSSLDSCGSNTTKRTVAKVSSPSSQSPSVSRVSRFGSLSSSVDRGSSSLSGRKKASTPDSRETRFMMLPQVEVKAGDDVRLDLRGHRVRSLCVGGLNLSQNLEFVYLRDNLLSSLEGIEILKRVKVLDLSFNDFKGPGFEPLENCKFLQQLYLAGNQIVSLASLPQLPNLEFLSVAQNRLKSLAMASQPRLQVLAASKNKISTLKGFPHLQVLEHLRVEENPILEMPHVEAASILLVGPTLKKFNDRDLSCDELEVAKRYPPHTAICIRDGWEFCRPEHAADSTFRFLLEQWKVNFPPGYTLKEASVEPPFEQDACRCHFVFCNDRNPSDDSELVLKYQWFIGEKTPTNFVAITDNIGEVYWPKNGDVGKFLKVECIPILREIEYPSVFAVSSPVSPGTGYPKVLNLSVQGELVEGNVIKGVAEVAWCGGTLGKGVASWLRRRWNSSPAVILGAEDDEYLLTIEDIDSSLVFMYTPVTEEGNKGEPQYAMTDFVKAAAPSVSGVQVIGDAVEGNMLRGIGKYFGGREGPSKFEWLRESLEIGEFVLVSTGTAEYTLNKVDIGRRLKFVYIPINFEGQEGKSASAVTEVVRKAPPKVVNIKMIGELREGSKISVAATVTGGSEGSSRVQWFKTNTPMFEDETCLEAVSASKIAKAFRIPLGVVGYYIIAKFTPMAPDGECGKPAYVISDKSIETLPPSINFLSVTGDYSEGEILTASYGYVGGHEGNSLYNWYMLERENDVGVMISEASGLLQYRIAKDAIGKFISFKCTPARDDGTMGEQGIYFGKERVQPGSPRLLSLQLVGKGIEGSTLHVEKKYWGGEEGSSVYHWFLIDEDGTQSAVKDASTSSYVLSKRDIGFQISVSCEPVRSDGVCGPTVFSECIGPILPGLPTCHSLDFLGSLMEGQCLSFVASYSGGEKGNCIHEWFRVRGNGVKDKLSAKEYLDLSLEDVGKCIELVYTPMRKDGLRGSSKSIISEVVAPAEPRGVELIIPDGCEDEEVVPRRSYFGGHEGFGDCTWYRTNRKLQGSDLLKISEATEDAFLVGKDSTYTPSLEDVGAYLVFRWVPTRSDGQFGKELVRITDNSVIPALPVVSRVCVKQLSSGIYYGEGRYYGGYEGKSLFSWYRKTIDGTIVHISSSNSRTYEVADDDYNCQLLFGYTPVRSDGLVGELKLSEPTDIILPELPRIQMLSLTGKAVEGEILTATETVPEDEIQHHVWEKYKKGVRYQWFYLSERTDRPYFEPMNSQKSSYKVRLEDIGRCLRCECIVTDVFGRSSEPASATTSLVLPGIPKIDKLEIEGRGFHTNLYAVRGTYSGGKEGKSRIQWLRAMVGSPDLISIPGEVGRMYEANVDDVGYRLVAIYTPVREDGIEGQPVSASTELIGVDPDIQKEVKQKLNLGSVKFEVLCRRDPSPNKGPVVGSLSRRILEVNRERVKVVKPGSKTSFPTTEIRGNYAPPFHVELFRNDQHRLRIVVDSENEVDLMVQTRHTRDIIVLVIRGIAQRFNSTSLNSLLKIET